MQRVNDITKLSSELLEKDIYSAVVLGNFDGVHLGHQKLFEIAGQYKDELMVIAFSFYPHPTWVLGHQPKQLIASREEKFQKIKQLGITTFVEYPFTTEISKLTPEEFFKQILVEKLHTKVVIVGSNYYFGKDQEGDISHLKNFGKKYGVEIRIIKEVKEEDTTISSTAIRQFIQDGEIEKAKQYLGEYFSISGEVVHGKELGRTIGFRTANITPEKYRIYPPNGVYATQIQVGNKIFYGMTNIGFNPTVDGEKKVIETHIFGFKSDIYGKHIIVTFLKYIRPEKKFESLEALINQLKHDKIYIQNFFNIEENGVN
ncbi:MAG: riboflavin biosynthesis protein RibF [Epulopiscium sp. Nele67-Bin005]|nr:MAG: riboflavin biosynthesis protein RibF [Epulopiscium sp. Nele67-Bin005]